MLGKEKEIEETDEIQIQHDEGGDDVSVNVAIEGEEEIVDRGSEVRKGLDGGRQIFKKLPSEE